MMTAIPGTFTLGWVFAGVGVLVALICIWRMISSRGKDLTTKRRITKLVILSVGVLIGLFVAVSSGRNAAMVHHARALTPGKTYLVRGRRMHMYCMGSGSPTLVLDAGLGNDSLIWGGVQPALAKTTRVCAYDRAGWGLSESVPGTQDANHIADELHDLLDAAEIHDPVVLMGHSIAGIYIRAFATRYRSQVEGLIFVDASTPLQDEDPVIGKSMPHGSPPRMRLLMVKTMAALGVPRVMGACSRHLSGFSAEAEKLQDAEFCDPHVDAGVGEMLHFHKSGEETAHAGSYGDLPVLVLSSDPSKQMTNHLSKDEVDAWERMQENLKRLSTRSRRIIAKNSGHYIQLERPDLIEREVPRFIEQIRGSQSAQDGYGMTTTE